MKRFAAAAVVAVILVACGTTYSAAEPELDGSAPEAGAGCTDLCPDDACGLVQLACGPTDCGACANPSFQCVDTKCKCVPKKCEDLGVQCGAVADGCGGEIFCGVCGAQGDAGPSDAGDAGAAALHCNATNMCAVGPCVPKTAAEACFSPSVRLCGKQPDGCGGLADCGTSACNGVGETCGGGGKAGQCGCTPQKSCSGACSSSCPNGCGGTRQCNCTNCH